MVGDVLFHEEWANDYCVMNGGSVTCCVMKNESVTYCVVKGGSMTRTVSSNVGQ